MLVCSLTHPFLLNEWPPWEANNYLVGTEIPHLGWCHFGVILILHPPMDPNLSQLNPAHTLTFYFLNLQLNIIYLSAVCPCRFFTTLFKSKLRMWYASLPCMLHICSTNNFVLHRLTLYFFWRYATIWPISNSTDDDDKWDGYYKFRIQV